MLLNNFTDNHVSLRNIYIYFYRFIYTFIEHEFNWMRLKIKGFLINILYYRNQKLTRTRAKKRDFFQGIIRSGEFAMQYKKTFAIIIIITLHRLFLLLLFFSERDRTQRSQAFKHLASFLIWFAYVTNLRLLQKKTTKNKNVCCCKNTICIIINHYIREKKNEE